MTTRLIAFEVSPAEGGGFRARGVEAGLFTQGETVEAVRTNALKTVKNHFFDHPGQYEVGTTLRLSDGHTERAVDHVQVS